jgi:cell wall assembly regulator SMI1
MELIESQKSLTLEEIQGFEKKFNVKLPKEFISLYLKYNGGIPTHEYYNGYALIYYMPIKYGKETNSIDYKMISLKEAELLPDGFLPFAYDSGGWYFALDLNETNYGAVYVIRNDMADDYPVFVAPSFKELLEGLTLEDDY